MIERKPKKEKKNLKDNRGKGRNWARIRSYRVKRR